MSQAPSSLGFADRHTATMDIMKALKNQRPDLPRTELMKTASEAEATCLDNAGGSRDLYLTLVREKTEELLLPLLPPTGSGSETTTTAAAEDANALETTTGVADRPGAERQVVGKHKEAVYHERSLNAVVYKSTSAESGEPVALKVVAVDGQVAPHDIRREARLLRSLSHPNILPLLGAEPMAGGLFALTLPFMRYDLASLAAATGGGGGGGGGGGSGSGGRALLSAARKRRLLGDVFRALEAVHAAGIVHRDVKPSNVLADSVDGPAYLMDFGISWRAGEGGGGEPADGKITDVGTGPYRAPELLFGCRDYGPELDMWAAGCTVAEVLVGGGRTLFDAGAVTGDDFLGSDLTLANSVFRKLGTPTDETWPEARSFRDWGKIRFKHFPPLGWGEMLPNVDEAGRDLVGKLVVYSGSRRLSARETLQHGFFGRQQES